ncbi:sigma-54 interaction domain-containing protein [Planctomicrobium sp. SH668]|uniref:sigma-54 interaction domain-containing protein n=1 Tax=Planctomicrobium sp. SH668 TaxID=3448126 RepID=UPI003F5B2A0A
MSLPAVVVATADERLARELAGRLSEQYHLSITTNLLQIPHLLRESNAAIAFLDVRFLAATEQVSIDLIHEIQVNHPQTQVIAAVRDGSFAQLNQLSSDGKISLIVGAPVPTEVARRFAESLQATPRIAFGPASNPPSVEPVASGTPEVSPVRETLGESVFEGVTRRFETRSVELKQMLDDLMIAASHDVTILLIGETGSGKTFLSNLIHEASPRRNEPFIHIACGALPRELIESELFGHTKGSFTSAHADKEGKFVAARKGTMLLDEIDVLGPEQQVKLLRVIETGEFEAVGSNVTFKSQARLVVASNLNLEPLVEAGKFRPDLYYRLNMLKFEIPPLRRRKIDIIPMAKKFVARFSEKHGIKIHQIDDSALEALLAYPWPGNVRELEHVIQRAVIYCRNGILSRESLPPHLLSGKVGPANDPSVQLGTIGSSSGQTLERQVGLSEKEIIEQVLFKNNFSRTRTAKDLGISRVTLYNKMKKHEMLK